MKLTSGVRRRLVWLLVEITSKALLSDSSLSVWWAGKAVVDGSVLPALPLICRRRKLVDDRFDDKLLPLLLPLLDFGASVMYVSYLYVLYKHKIHKMTDGFLNFYEYCEIFFSENRALFFIAIGDSRKKLISHDIHNILKEVCSLREVI